MDFVAVPIEAAIQRGWLFYVTGEPCVNGHIARRRISSRACILCERERARRNGKEQYAKHREKRAAYAKEYGSKNREKLTKYQTAYAKNRCMTDTLFLLTRTLQARVRNAFSRASMKKQTSTSQMLGCSIEEFKSHIERQFVNGMTWDNRSQWHIDHIIPCVSAKNVEELEALFHFTNLRPIWAKDNLVKRDKVLFLL